MGCSASRLDTLIAKAIEDPSSTPSSSSLSSNNSSFYNSSCSSKLMAKKARSLSAPLVHHPAVKKGDTHHLVCLTSSTYGSLVVVDSNNGNNFVNNNDDNDNNLGCFVEDGGFTGGSSPDSVINTWELMEGLEENEENEVIKLNSLNLFDFNGAQKLPILQLGSNLIDFNVNSSSLCEIDDAHKKPRFNLDGSVKELSDFDVKSSTFCDIDDAQKRTRLNLDDSMMKLNDSYVFVEVPGEIVEESSTKPLWKHLSEESLLSKMDPNVDNTYHKALSAKKLGCSESRNVSRSVESSPYVLKSKCVESRTPLVSKLLSDDDSCKGSGFEDKVVLYFTSLRGIRKTYEDCCSVRMILKGFRVVVDERDISMDSSFRKELQGALRGKTMSLPQLFVRGWHIGNADDVKLLHETGELERLLDGFPTQDCGFVCESCGDARFVPCSNCNGSRKVFEEDEDRTRRCLDCNENGLVRCPVCCT